MSNESSFLAVLGDTPGAICDDCMALRASFSQRQTSYRIGELLATKGMVVRETGECALCGKQKKVSRPGKPIPSDTAPIKPEKEHSWYWEGNVQSRVVAFLIRKGFTIRSIADASDESVETDIVAISPTGRELWVRVKGYPEEGESHSRLVQGRHCFAGALFDVALGYCEKPNIELAMALPVSTTYQNLAERIRGIRDILPFHIFWVRESGEVTAG